MAEDMPSLIRQKRAVFVKTRFVSPRVPELCACCGAPSPLTGIGVQENLNNFKVFQNLTKVDTSILSGSTTEHYTYSTVNLSACFKICETCMKVKRVNDLAIKTSRVIAILIALIFFVVLSGFILSQELNPIFILLGAVVLIFFWFFLERWLETRIFSLMPVKGVQDKWKHRALSNEYVSVAPQKRYSRGKSSEEVVYDDEILYRFSNKKYGLAFYQMNQEIIVS